MDEVVYLSENPMVTFIDGSFPIAISVALCLGVIFLRRSLQEKVYLCAFILYTGILLALTLFPIPLGYDHAQSMLGTEEEMNIVYIPFESIIDSLINDAWHNNLRNIGGNLVLLTPLGWFLPLLFKVRTAKKVAIISLFVSLSIELVQFLMMILLNSSRIASVDDLILNTIGGIIGYYVYKLFLRKLLLNTL